MVLLAQGDITRRDAILWGYGPKSAGPWLEYCERNVLWREIELAKAGVGALSPEDDYCRACRDLGEDDCDNCVGEIKVTNGHQGNHS